MAFRASLAVAAMLLLIWIGAAAGPGSMGFRAHLSFSLVCTLAGGLAFAVRRAMTAQVDEIGDLEFSVESSSAQQVAAESALLVYRDMLQEAGIGWYRLDADGHLVSATQATADLLGYTSIDQMRDVYAGQIFPASEHRRAVLSALRAVGEVRGHSAFWPTAEGDILQVRDSARTIRDHEGRIVYIEGFVSADTWAPGSDARIQRLETDLAAARAAVLKGPENTPNASSDLRYVAHISHELRTPLNAIVGAISLLDSSQLDRSHRELLDTLRLATDSLISVVNNTLDYSRLESGSEEIESGPVDARACMEDAIDLVAQKAMDQGLEVAYRIAEDVPEAFLGDGRRVRQVLTNLLANAVRFTERGEILVRLDASPGGDGSFTYHFSVRDTGAGVPADRQKRLFEPYYQADSDAGRRLGGTGLGLAISRLLVERMGGRIWVESQPGAGSTFHFTVIARPAQVRRMDTRPLAGLRALLLDDQSSSRSTITSLLESLQVSVNATNRTDLTLDLLTGKSTFDLVVVSLESGVNSITFASRLRSQGIASDLPIVIVAPSGSGSQPPSLARCFRILKPVRRDRLAEALLRAIDPTVVRDQDGTPATGPGPARLSVLVAEDDVVNGRIIVKMIERLGHRTTLVERGDAVVAEAVKNRYDLLILDVRMPGLTGPEAARDLLAALGTTRPAPRIIGMTASTDPAEHRQCLEAGMETCLLKPITPQLLAEQLSVTGTGHGARNSARREPEPEPGLPLGRWLVAEDGEIQVVAVPVVEPGPIPSTGPAAAAPDPMVASIRRAVGGRFRNDRAAVPGAIAAFERLAPSLVRDLASALQAGEYTRLAETAARMKDESHAVGLTRIAALGKALEATARGNPRPGAVGPFVRALQVALDEARPVLDRERERLEAERAV